MGFEYLKVFTGRRFPFDYISPAVCEGEFSSSGTPFISLLPILRAHGPTGPVMTVNGGRFHFSWDVVFGALCYSVYKAVDDPFGPYVLVAECITDNFIELDDDGTYKVLPITKDGTGEFSDPVTTPHLGGGGGGGFGAWWTFSDSNPHIDAISSIPLNYLAGAPAATSAPGKIGDGWRFAMSGNNSVQYETADRTELRQLGTGFTIYLWLNFAVLSGGTGQAVSVFYNTKDGDGNTVSATTFQFTPGQFRVIGPGGVATIALTVFDMGLDTWHFARVSYDSVTGKSKISLDGGAATETAGTDFSVTAAATGSVRVLVSTAFPSGIDATMDELAIVIGPQSDADVLAIYNSGAGKTWPL